MITRFTMFKVFLNSFFIQSAWSFEKMQGLGFAAAIAPAINEIYEDKEQACIALKRHMSYYNAHPYMAAPILGAVIKMEEEANTGRYDVKNIASFKQNLIGPYGAIGDTFFWGAVRPFASIIGVISAFIWGLWGPIIFLAVYNLFHLWMRWLGLWKGYRLGEDVVEYIKFLSLPQWALRIRLIATGFLGALAAMLIVGTGRLLVRWPFEIYQIFLIAIVSAGLIVLLSSMIRNRVSVSLAVYMLFLPAFVFLVVMYIIK